MTSNQEIEAFIEWRKTVEWHETTDREGRRAHYLPTGQVVCKDGDGRRSVTVYYRGYVNAFNTGDRHGAGFCTVTTIREGKEQAEADAFTA